MTCTHSIRCECCGKGTQDFVDSPTYGVVCLPCYNDLAEEDNVTEEDEWKEVRAQQVRLHELQNHKA